MNLKYLIGGVVIAGLIGVFIYVAFFTDIGGAPQSQPKVSNKQTDFLVKHSYKDYQNIEFSFKLKYPDDIFSVTEHPGSEDVATFLGSSHFDIKKFKDVPLAPIQIEYYSVEPKAYYEPGIPVQDVTIHGIKAKQLNYTKNKQKAGQGGPTRVVIFSTKNRYVAIVNYDETNYGKIYTDMIASVEAYTAEKAPVKK